MTNVAIIDPGSPERRSAGALTPLDMLNRALETGASMDVLEKFMSLHERWEISNARKAFDAAISEAKAEIPPIVKNAKGHNDKRYANFAATEDDDGRAAGSGGAITEEQVERLQREIMDADADLPKFLAHFKVEALADLPASRFDAAMQADRPQAEAVQWMRSFKARLSGMRSGLEKSPPPALRT